MRTRPFAFILAVVGLAATATAQNVRPILEESTLVAGERETRPTWVFEETFREIEVGEVRIRLGRSFVARVDANGEEIWRVPLSGKAKERYIGSHGRIAFFARLEVDQSNAGLDFETGIWIPPLEFELPPPSMRTTDALVAEPLYLLSEEDGCTMLVGWRNEGEDAVLREYCVPVFDCYSIVCFDVDLDETRWVHHEPSRGERPMLPMAFRMFREPDGTPRATHVLARTDFGLVACAGDRGDILCLDASSGQLNWRLERLWEFDRGYVGASCFDYIVSRFGDEYRRQELVEMGIEVDWLRPMETVREEFEERYSCAITGGPLVVPKPGDRTRAGQALLVVVERGPATGLCKALSESRVYEIDSRGRPVAVAPLPRRLLSEALHRDPRGVTWAGPEGAFLHCSASDNDGEVSMGPGWEKQCVARIDWYRELSWNPVHPWLRTETERDVIVFGAGAAFRPAAGMYVNASGDKLVHCPIWRVHLKDQRAEVLDLRIPTELPIPAPGGSYERRGDRYRAHGPWLLRLTDLDIVGDHLRVTIESDESVRMMEFDLGTLDD